MSIGIVVEAKLKPETVEEAKQFFKEIIPDTRNFEGCESVDVCVDAEDPTTLFLVERWAAKENYEKYHHWRQENGTLDQLRSFLAGGVKRNFLEYVA